MRFHVISLPHTQTTYDYEVCAYTAKQRKLCNMLSSLGHSVYLYASEENEAACDELITIAPKKKQKEWFGDHDFRVEFFNIEWDPSLVYWRETNATTIRELKKRLQPKDIICVIGGICHQPIAEAFPKILTVESGVGYPGVFSKYRVFESYAWMHYILGSLKEDSGRFFDAVIPNYFETDKFPYSSKPGDYFLFMGRLIARKGPEIAVEVTRRLGGKLLVAGQGVVSTSPGEIRTADMILRGDHVEYVGHADVAKRAALLSRAKAVFVPTTYVEPFGGVAVEALLCGTPVIATDFGAFTETIQHGVNGFRFRTIGEAVWGANQVAKLDRKQIRRQARANYSTERIKYLYEAYFEQLQTLWDDGFYTKSDTGVSKYRRYQRY